MADTEAKPDKSEIASNLLKNIAGLNKEKNDINDQGATKLVLAALVRHVSKHIQQMWTLSSWAELQRDPQLVCDSGTWDGTQRMDPKLRKRHELRLAAEVDQVKASLEVVRDFIKTPTDRFCCFTARILTDSEVLDTVSCVLDSRFDYGLAEHEVTAQRAVGSGVSQSGQL